MNKKILIIEDDKEMCKELTEALTDLGNHVQTAFDGLSGKKMIESTLFDIIILDLKLPILNGYQIIEVIKKNKINSKVIVITARIIIDFEKNTWQNQTQKENDILKEVNAVLVKPFTVFDLINKINN